MKDVLKLNYDPKNDVLYVRFSDETNVYGDEHPDNIVAFRSLDTDALTGLTIFDYWQMYTTHDRRLDAAAGLINLSAINRKLEMDERSMSPWQVDE